MDEYDSITNGYACGNLKFKWKYIKKITTNHGLNNIKSKKKLLDTSHVLKVETQTIP